MKKYIVCSILCIAICMMANGCRGQIDIDAEEALHGQETSEDDSEEDDIQDAQETMEEIVVDTEDGEDEYRFALPEGWEICKNKRNEQTVIELQGSLDDQYAAVVVLDKNILENINIQKYIQQYAEEARKTYPDALVGQEAPLTIEEYTAHKLFVRGTLEEKEYINWVYFVDAQQYLYVITSCAYTTNEESLKEDMDIFVESFVVGNTMDENTEDE